MLQAGLKAEVTKCYTGDVNGKEIDIGNPYPHPEHSVTVFELFISDSSVKTENRKRTLGYAIPVCLLSIHEAFMTYFYLWNIRFNSLRTA